MVKVVLINNGESSYQTLEQGLSIYGYEVITTHRGDDGLLLALTESPDLILVDINTPILDGWQLIKNLKRSRATWLIPVLAIAERAIDGGLLIQAGFDAYDRKPVLLKHILKRIDALLGSNMPEQTKLNILSNQSLSDINSFAQKANSSEKISKATNFKQASASVPVVYVDDSPKDSQLMAEILQKAGFSYVNIGDSLQALPQLLELKPQLIFLDLVMPMANGYELCAQIRRITAFKKTPIVIVTNNNGIADRLRSRFVGAYGFLHKPIKEKRVLQVLKKYGCKPNVYEISY